jgi:hypothetical protein
MKPPFMVKMPISRKGITEDRCTERKLVQRMSSASDRKAEPDEFSGIISP